MTTLSPPSIQRQFVIQVNGVWQIDPLWAQWMKDLQVIVNALNTGSSTALAAISGASWSNGAGAAAGTLLNAPAAGNPTKWIPVNDNGTTRYIPAW